MRVFLAPFLALFLLPATVICQNPPALETAAKTIQPSQSGEAAPAAQLPLDLRIPDGVAVEIEAPYTFSSMDFKPKDKISFRVVDAIKIDGVTVIEQGATATGRVEKSKRGGHWGKAGLFVWTMESVTGVNGAQIPVRETSVRLRGDSKGAKVATAMIITGAVMPLIAPVALLHGFKRGENAYIPAGKRYTVFVENRTAAAARAAAVK